MQNLGRPFKISRVITNSGNPRDWKNKRESMYEEEMRRKVTGFVYEKQNKKKRLLYVLPKLKQKIKEELMQTAHRR